MSYLNRGSARMLQGKGSEAGKDFEKSLALGRNIKEFLENRIKAVKGQHQAELGPHP